MIARRFASSVLSLAAAVALCVGLLAGCSANGESPDVDVQQTTEPVAVNVAALKGPTAMGMVKLMADTDAENADANTTASADDAGAAAGAASADAANADANTTASADGADAAADTSQTGSGSTTGTDAVRDEASAAIAPQFSIYASADEITPKLVQGEIDIAAVPANLASVLWNNTDGAVQVAAVNTLGVLYICEAGDTVHAVSDLAGKTIYAAGKGSTPEYALDYILEGNGLVPDQDVTVEWKSEHAECVAALANDPDGIALLPQPFVTTAQMQNPEIRVALDLTEEWDALQDGSDDASALITGALVVRTDFAQEHPEAVDAFLERYRASVDYVNANVEDAARLVGSYDIVKAEVAERAIPACRIVCITGDEMKGMLSGYLAVLLDANPASVGGELPGDAFYYGASA